ncbi:MAG: alpha/beta hydrolase [Atopobiaceae bacterium]|nr:alpha/beta hydrolase [Atopobiaceae bacterium]
MSRKSFIIGGNERTSLDVFLLATDRPLPLVIVCPGGGFLDCSPNEGEPVARRLNAEGFHAAVLTYSTEASAPGACAYPRPLLDLAEAMAIVRDHAAKWLVDPDKVATLGFSAGGYLCASYANTYATDELLRPNANVLCYPVVDFRRYAALGSLEGTMDLGQVTGDVKALAFAEFMRTSVRGAIGDARLTPELMDEMSPLDHLTPDVPPTFVWTTFGDSLVDPTQSIEYALRLRELGVPCELHVFGRGEHGLSLADETTAKKPSGLDPHLAHWATLAAEWLRMTL